MSRFLCNIKDIEKYEGYFVANPIYDEKGRLLLNTNCEINDKVKKSLDKNCIEIVWLSKEKIKELEEQNDSNLVTLKQKRKALQGTFSEIKEDILSKKNNNKMQISLTKKNIKKIEDAIDSIIDQIIENPFVAATLEPLYEEADYLIRHSVNVTYYGLCMVSNYPGIIDILKDKKKGLLRFQPKSNINPKSLEINTFGMACFLHDIGKIYILNTIGKNEYYSKDSEESKEIWEEIKKHTSYGHDILFGKQIDAHVLLGIKYHHENWDGTGYPFGIKGYKIHPFSRIIRVLDSFEAAISKGPGRNNKDFKTILGELLGLSGQHYDSEIVKYFIDLLLGGKSGLVSKGFVVD